MELYLEIIIINGMVLTVIFVLNVWWKSRQKR